LCIEQVNIAESDKVLSSINLPYNLDEFESGTAITSLKCEHVRLFRRENSDSSNVRWWSSGYTLASYGSNPGTAIGCALLMSSNKSETRVQSFPRLVWTHQNNYVRTIARPFKRECCDYLFPKTPKLLCNGPIINHPTKSHVLRIRVYISVIHATKCRFGFAHFITLFMGVPVLITGIAGCVSRTATAPLDRIKLTWQALGGKAAEGGLMGSLKKMLREGGVASLWRGNGVNCLKIAPESAIKFQAYEIYKKWLGEIYGDPKNGPISMETKFFSGALAGATSQTIIYPMEVLKTRMCLRKSGQYSSIFDCARKLYHENGWRIFYRGYVPNILGILPYAGIELALFETFKQTYARWTSKDGKEPSGPPSVYVSVSAGALSSVCGQLGTYPLALVRTKLQAQTAGSERVSVHAEHTG
ncbi:hypothetical protein T265_15525, partial [Opisthorchis viverrini]